MKYIFDFMEFDVTNADEVTVCRYGKKAGLNYSVSIRRKNWLERLTSQKQVHDIPNIILRRRFRGMKLVFTKLESGQFKFTLLSWIIPFGVGSKTMNYAKKSVVIYFISDLGKRKIT